MRGDTPHIWPVEDLDRHLKLAIEKLEAISELEDYQGDPHIAAEIAELRSRLFGTSQPGSKSPTKPTGHTTM